MFQVLNSMQRILLGNKPFINIEFKDSQGVNRKALIPTDSIFHAVKDVVIF